MPFSRPRFTNAGRQLQLRAIGGTNINFTRIKVGDGVLPEGTDFRELTDLVSPKASLPLTKIRVEDGYAKITGYFNNSELTEAFYYRELGLYATDPDDPTNEILYCYANYGDDSVYIAQPSSEIIERTVTIVAIVDDAENVTATLDTSAVYVTEPELTDALEAHNTDPDAHPNLQNSTKTLVAIYINPSSTEAAENRTGTAAHPFKYLGEALTAYPAEAVSRLSIAVTNSFVLYADADKASAGDNGTYTISNYESITIYGVSSNYVKFPGKLKFLGCQTVGGRYGLYSYTKNGSVHVNSRLELESGWLARLKLSYNVNPDVFDSTEPLYTIKNFEMAYLNGEHAEMKKSPSGGVVYVLDSTVRSEIKMGSLVDPGFVLGANKADTIICDFEDNSSIPLEAEPYDGSTCNFWYFNWEDLMSIGTLSSHVSRTDNPHQVTLTQAAAAGGVLPVSNGGTGKTTFTSGHVLIGNGANGISSIQTLPVVKGGTGQNSLAAGEMLIGAGTSGIQSLPFASSSSSTYKGHIRIGDILINFGRVLNVGTDAVSDTFSKAFLHNEYNVIFSTSKRSGGTDWDSALNIYATKSNGSVSFKCDDLSGSDPVARLDYIAIGQYLGT